MRSRPCSSANRSSSGRAGHVHLLLVDDLAQHPRRVQAREPGQVDGRLGVARPFEDAALARLERKDVAGTGEIFRSGCGIDERLDRRGAVEGRDAGARSVAEVDGHQEGGALALGVLHHHRVQVQLTSTLGRDRRADVARRVVQEERDLLRGDELGGHDQVAFVLAVLVVDHDDDLTSPDGGDRVFDRCERHQPCSFHASRRSTYLAVTSTSRFTRSPARL